MKSNIVLILGFLAAFLICNVIFAQTSVNMSSTSVEVQCGTVINYYDDGGTARYSKTKKTTTQVITSCSGGPLTINFQSFAVSSGDVLTIYNGSSTGTKLVELNDVSTASEYIASSGTMTLVFNKTSANNKAGWVAEISCMRNLECAILTSPSNAAVGVSVLPNLLWSEVDGAEGYKLYWSTSSTKPVTVNATITNRATSSFMMTTPLSVTTKYYWWVVPYDNCGDLNACASSSFTTLTPTLCEAKALPYSENFDLYDGGEYSDDGVGVEPDCWKLYTDNISYSTGVRSSGTYFYKNSGSSLGMTVGNDGSSAYAYMPKFSDDLNNATINLWRQMENVENGVLTLGYSVANDGNSTFVEITTIPAVSSGENWTYDLSDYSGTIPNGAYLCFKWNNYTSFYTVCIDDVSITKNSTEVPSACATLLTPANNFMKANVKPILSWSAVADAKGYYIYWSTSNVKPSSPNATVEKENNYEITEALNEGTKYYWWVVPFNSVGVAISCDDGFSFTTRSCVTSELIGDGSTSNDNTFTSVYYKYSYGQTVYSLEDLVSKGVVAGEIQAMSINVTTAANNTYVPNYTVYMGHKSDAFSSTTDWVAAANLTQVATITTNIFSTTGWKEIMLSTPFVWDGVNDLVIAVSNNSGVYDSRLEIQCTDVVNSYLYVAEDEDDTYANHPGTTAGTISKKRFNVKFCTIPPTDPPASCATLIFPADEAVNVSSDVNLEWTPVAGASGYYIYMETTNVKPANPICMVTGGIHRQTIYHLDPSTKYYWWVVPFNSAGAAISCDNGFSFTTRSCVISESIGNGSTSNDNTFTSVNYKYSYGQTVYSVEDLVSKGVVAGEIQAMSINVTTAANNTYVPNYTVYMGHKSDVFSSTTDWVAAANLTQVATITTNILSTTGWKEIMLSTPFVWDGVSDLVIAVSNNSGVYDSQLKIQCTDVTNSYLYVAEDEDDTYANHPGTTAGTISKKRFNVKFCTIPPTDPPASCATLINPANGADNVNVKTELRWSVVAGATGYYVYLSTGNTRPANPTCLVKNANYYKCFTALLPTTKYYCWIVPFNEVGEAQGCNTSFSFTTNEGYCIPTFTSTTVISYISNVTTSGGDLNIDNTTSGSALTYFYYPDKKLIASAGSTIDISVSMWSKSITTTFGYAVWIDYDKNGIFSSLEKVCSTESYKSSPFEGSFIIPSNISEGEYRMRIVADQNENDPNNSCLLSTGEVEDYILKIVNPTSVPNCATVVSPVNGSTNVLTIPTFEWNAVADAAGYKVYLSTTNVKPTDPFISLSGRNNCSLKLSYSLFVNRTYYLWVEPFNAIGNAVSCEAVRFTTSSEASCDLSKAISYGTVNSSSVPICQSKFDDCYSYSQMLYNAEELSMAGVNSAEINSIAFEYFGDNLYDHTQTFKLFMANTTIDKLSSSSYVSEGLTQVFDGTVTFSKVENGTNWVTIEFDNPFIWDKMSNIIIAMYNTSVVDVANYHYFKTTDVEDLGYSNMATYCYSTQSISLTNNVPSSNSNNVTNIRPNIKFCTILPQQPPSECALLTNPIDGETNVSNVLVTMSWNSVENATGYYLYWNDENVMPVTPNAIVHKTFYSSYFIPTTKFYWWVVPFNVLGCVNGCTTSNNFTTSEGPIYIPGGYACENSTAFCTESSYAFLAEVDNAEAENGPDYGCLSSQPNPVWYFMYISEPGPLKIRISSTAGDVDYACWGPFPNMTCDANNLTVEGDPTGPNYDQSYGNMVDCAYSIDSIEFIEIPNVQVGEYYMVLITNYENEEGLITFEKIAGTGSASCEIVADCIVTSITANVSNEINGFYSVAGDISFVEPPTTGILKICDGANCQDFLAPFDVSPVAFNLQNIPADGEQHLLVSYFTEVDCERKAIYTAPFVKIVLPVEYLHYEAVCQNDGVKIEWITASQQNCNYFVVEKINEDGNFVPIAIVPCDGTSSLTKYYSFVDNNIVDKINYYRIKQVDFDGTTDFTSTFVSNCEGSNTFQMNAFYFDNKINVEFDAESEEEYFVSIFETSGKQLHTEMFVSNYAERVRVSIPCKTLSSGAYFVKISSKKISDAEKIIIP